MNFAVPTAAYRFGDGAMEPNVLFQPVLVKYLIEMLKTWKRARTKLERHFGKAASSFEAAETPNRPTDDKTAGVLPIIKFLSYHFTTTHVRLH